MADVPPWSNFAFNSTTLLCPIITGLLLLIFPPDVAKLLSCHYKSGGTLLHHQLWTLPHCHQPRKKKSTEATPAAMIELTTQMAALIEINVTLQGQVNARASVTTATSFARTPSFRGQYDLLDFSKRVDLSVYKKEKTLFLREKTVLTSNPRRLDFS